MADHILTLGGTILHPEVGTTHQLSGTFAVAAGDEAGLQATLAVLYFTLDGLRSAGVLEAATLQLDGAALPTTTN